MVLVQVLPESKYGLDSGTVLYTSIKAHAAVKLGVIFNILRPIDGAPSEKE